MQSLYLLVRKGARVDISCRPVRKYLSSTILGTFVKKLSIYDRANGATFRAISPEWGKIRRARKAATAFDNPDVDIPTEFRTLAGRNIRLAEAGPVDAPTVVMLSPFPESILSFVGSWEALTQTFRVVAIDLPGFGASEGDRNDMTPAAQGELLGKILDDLDLTDIHLVAPDVGMAAALSYALTPNRRLASMVVGHSVGAPGPLKLAMLINLMSRFGILRWNTALLGAGPLIAFTSTFGAIRHRYNPTQVDDFKRAYSGRAFEVIHWFANLRGNGEDLARQVSEIDVPTQIFWGELDALFDVSNAHHLHQAMPKSALQIFPEAGHLSWSDQPEMFATMIIDWVNTGHKNV